mgnify:CR=1 FL=1
MVIGYNESTVSVSASGAGNSKKHKHILSSKRNRELWDTSDGGVDVLVSVIMDSLIVVTQPSVTND